MTDSVAGETSQGEQIASTITTTCTGCEQVQTHDVLGRGAEGQFLLRCQTCNSEDLYALPEHAKAVEEAYSVPLDEQAPERPQGDARQMGERVRRLADEEAERVEREEDAPAEAPRVPPSDPYTRTCPTCAGFGMTQTGSVVDGQEFRECIDCNGRGWQERMERPEAQPGETEPPAQPQDNWAWR